MNKIIGSKEDYMGTLLFSPDSIKGTFISIDQIERTRWEFKLKGKQISGRLIYKDELYRIIDIKKED